MLQRLALTDPHYDYYFSLLCRLVLQAVFPEVLMPWIGLTVLAMRRRSA